MCAPWAIGGWPLRCFWPVRRPRVSPSTLTQSADSRPTIPRTWDEDAIASVAIPLAVAAASPKHIPADYYYRMPVRPVFRSYPVYAPGYEPAGYIDSLRRLQPEILFDTATSFASDAEWLRVGELVFEAPIAFDGEPLEIMRLEQARDSSWYRQTGVLTTKDHIMPYARYMVRTPGVVEVGSLACAMCHTRVMPDGTVLKGAQGNFPFDRAIAALLRAKAANGNGRAAAWTRSEQYQRCSSAAPWLKRTRQGISIGNRWR